MKKAPESYLDCRRPQLLEAISLEGNITTKEAIKLLEKKGYFTPHPRPWKLGFLNRGLGRGDFGILDRFGDLVAEKVNKENAELIIVAVNTYRENNL